MAKVACEVSYQQVKNEKGIMVDGVKLTCSRCAHETWSYGTSERSIRRCLALMGEQCPEGENNFYVSEDDNGG